MKSCVKYLLFILVAVITSTSGHAQQIRGAVIGGFNLSQVDGDEVYGFKKPGLNLGAAAIVPFTDRWSVSLETLFNQKGSREREQYRTTDTNDVLYTGEYKLRLDYLEVPVLVHYNDRDRITAGVGFSWGRLVNVEEWEHGRKVETTTLNSGTYDPNDINILADIRFRLYKRFRMNFRYSYSLAKIRTREFEPIPGTPGKPEVRDQYNNLLSFRIIYIFNEKPPTADTRNEDASF